MEILDLHERGQVIVAVEGLVERASIFWALAHDLQRQNTDSDNALHAGIWVQDVEE